jgi:hypothetical protein
VSEETPLDRVMAYLFWLGVGACLWLSGFMTALWLFVDRYTVR